MAGWFWGMEVSLKLWDLFRCFSLATCPHLAAFTFSLMRMRFYFPLAISTWLLTFFKMFHFFLRIESIDKMESDFKNCHMFLVTILNKAVCRGSFPHCKSSTAPDYDLEIFSFTQHMCFCFLLQWSPWRCR